MITECIFFSVRGVGMNWYSTLGRNGGAVQTLKNWIAFVLMYNSLMTKFYRKFSSQIQKTFFSERGYRWPRVWASGLLPLRLLQNQHRHDRYEISVNCNQLLSVCLGLGEVCGKEALGIPDFFVNMYILCVIFAPKFVTFLWCFFLCKFYFSFYTSVLEKKSFCIYF